jgi:hypothetical protein
MKYYNNKKTISVNFINGNFYININDIIILDIYGVWTIET